MKKKILVTTGTRAEYGILRQILFKISKSKKLKLFLVVTGTHLSKKHGLTINEIKKDGFKIYKTIPLFPKANTNYSMAKTLGETIVEFAKIFSKVNPDINLVLGDRDEMLASALAASHMNIINAHISGGDKSGGIDEYNRHAITKISNLHFSITKKSQRRIIRMGENPKHVFFSGSPSIDELAQKKISKKFDLEKNLGIKFSGNEIILLQHPLTTQVHKTVKHIQNVLKAIAKLKITTIAIAPNSDAGSEIIFKNLKKYSKKYNFIKLYSNLPREDFLGLLKYSGVLIGNSSSGLTEAGFFGTPVINIGIRQKNRDRANNVIDLQGNNITEIFSALKKSLKIKKRGNFMNSKIFGKGNASTIIVQILEKIDINQNLIDKQIYY